jgi:hypothetical protein
MYPDEASSAPLGVQVGYPRFPNAYLSEDKTVLKETAGNELNSQFDREVRIGR